MAPDLHASTGDHVCVVGTGVLGLVAIKNLKEQGLQVTAFERNEHIGGLWHVSDNQDQVTATSMTTANTSKHTVSGAPSLMVQHVMIQDDLTSDQSCFTDFPYTDDVSMHPPAKSIHEYLESYAKHFGLLQHIRYSSQVTRVERDDESRKWIVYTVNASQNGNTDSSRHVFDRLVVATGILSARNVVKIPGVNQFDGEVLHSQEFKDAYRFSGKNVLVVGIGATGADTTSFLKKAGAANIYISHRGQTYLLPRVMDGKAFDHSMSYRVGCITRQLASWSPWAWATMLTKALRTAQFKAFPWLKSHNSFSSPRVPPTAPMLHRVPIFSDDLAQNLRDGSVKSVVGVHEINGPRTVMLTDGSVLSDIDAIVICSGYHYDFSVVSGAGNPIDATKAPDNYRRIQAAPYYEPESPFPRLYQGYISEQYPESLAFLGHMLVLGPPFVIYDLATMALASIWSGNAPMPTDTAMSRDINAHYDFIVKALHNDRVPHPGVRINGKATYNWMNEAAGTGVTDLLGNFSIAACKLWWTDRHFYNLLMDGASVPAVYRLFDMGRGRKPWNGARKHIEKINKEIEDLGMAWKREKAKLN
ncbi:flavin-binding monooxygenase-like-domain-containing protein [Truncatella angustata]|uniref:Flavin-binding monooxygenase-like-domain-containing protein n=1 Tax=Truncatella angustata TaxID=152316 RepID=A0A9P8UF56_9PEZI|nr:flavin-binding monooxygenase-like-domain-containing protein [Truncatella angustata]KAH6648794.1 flavin-binding monooxygenase-like-domain-containing protein [Truncatella angustata]KAH8200857.1 hypothetical protein TruAng_004943 [Truncatella angustata]